MCQYPIVDVGLRHPSQHKVGWHLNSVYLHFNCWITSVSLYSPIFSKRLHANTTSTCYMLTEHVCMNMHAHMHDRTDSAMVLAKPAESLHESMHASRDIYNLLIDIKISTRNMKSKILCPSRGMCTNTAHSTDMLACTCMHGWSR